MSDLMKLAADMARGSGLPSEFDADHPPRRTRGYWIGMLEIVADRARQWAIQVRGAADEIERLRARLAEAERRLIHRPNILHGAEGMPCCCLFDDDEELLQECDYHRPIRERLAEAEGWLRKVLNAYTFAEVDLDSINAFLTDQSSVVPEEPMVTYHGGDPLQRFRQRKCDPLPKWAQDVQDEAAIKGTAGGGDAG